MSEKTIKNLLKNYFIDEKSFYYLVIECNILFFCAMMYIGGLQKFSLVDYPGKIACVVFCQGCCMRCNYCHNKQLQQFEENSEDLFSFLQKRNGLLDAVVFSGGEPLLQHDLDTVISDIRKNFNFSIGLHTSGVFPEMFKKVICLIDWVGFDIKTDFEHYENVTHYKDSGKFAKQCLDILVNSGKEFEIRTTYDPRLISNDNLLTVARTLNQYGIKLWHIQECVLRDTNEPLHLPLPEDDILLQIRKFVDINIRRA